MAIEGEVVAAYAMCGLENVAEACVGESGTPDVYSRTFAEETR